MKSSAAVAARKRHAVDIAILVTKNKNVAFSHSVILFSLLCVELKRSLPNIDSNNYGGNSALVQTAAYVVLAGRLNRWAGYYGPSYGVCADDKHVYIVRVSGVSVDERWLCEVVHLGPVGGSLPSIIVDLSQHIYLKYFQNSTPTLDMTPKAVVVQCGRS